MCVSGGTRAKDMPWDRGLFQEQNELEQEHKL